MRRMKGRTRSFDQRGEESCEARCEVGKGVKKVEWMASVGNGWLDWKQKIDEVEAEAGLVSAMFEEKCLYSRDHSRDLPPRGINSPADGGIVRNTAWR